MIQEFIPGRIKENLFVVVDHDACIRSFMRTEVLKIRQRLVQDSVASFRIAVDSLLYVQAQALMREIGTWGGFTCQTKIDARDGVPKLLEINPRLGMAIRAAAVPASVVSHNGTFIWVTLYQNWRK